MRFDTMWMQIEVEMLKLEGRFSPDEAYMDTETPMNGGAIDAEEDPERNRRPSRVPRITIETDLNRTTKPKQFEFISTRSPIFSNNK